MCLKTQPRRKNYKWLSILGRMLATAIPDKDCFCICLFWPPGLNVKTSALMQKHRVPFFNFWTIIIVKYFPRSTPDIPREKWKRLIGRSQLPSTLQIWKRPTNNEKGSPNVSAAHSNVPLNANKALKMCTMPTKCEQAPLNRTRPSKCEQGPQIVNKALQIWTRPFKRKQGPPNVNKVHQMWTRPSKYEQGPPMVKSRLAEPRPPIAMVKKAFQIWTRPFKY